MNLSDAQQQLLQQLETSIERGLTTDQASVSRERDGGVYNCIRPPVDCPAWLCIVLPCISHLPSMKAFQRIVPEDAEVLRNGKWIRYDATSLVKGDIIRLEEGDVVPADCVVLSINGNELLVDHRLVTGEDKPRGSIVDPKLNVAKPTQLFWGAQVVQGSGLAVVAAIGPNTLVASLIREGSFPPKGNIMDLKSASVVGARGGGYSDNVDGDVVLTELQGQQA